MHIQKLYFALLIHARFKTLYRRLLAAWAENNYLQVYLNSLEILDSVCLKNLKFKIKIGLASHPIQLWLSSNLTL